MTDTLITPPPAACSAHKRHRAECRGCIEAERIAAQELAEWRERHARAQVEHAQEVTR